jgi:predicted MFS family arabinose efflux permease
MPSKSSYSRLAWSNLSAQSADQVALAAAPIVAVLALGAGAGEAGLLQTAQTLPYLLLALPAGMLADRFSRKQLMVAAESLRVVALLGVLALAMLNALSWSLLALLGFVAASGTVAYSVAAPALLPSLVQKQELATANARIELARTVALSAGPAAGGALVGWLSASFAFGLAAALSACAVLLLAGIREPARPKAAPRPLIEEVREGAAFVARHELLRPVFATQLVFNMAFFVLLAVFVPYAIEHLKVTATGTGVLLAFTGIGMLCGALVAGRVLRALPLGTVIAIGPVCGFAGAMLVALTTRAPEPALAAAGLFLIGAGPILWVIATVTLRQSVTPGALLGRVSAMFMLATGARPIGAAIGAAAGAALGASAALYVAAVLFFLQAILILASPVVRLVSQPSMAPAVAS